MIFHLAEINVAHCMAPLDDPLMADFVALLDVVNAAAEASPGFVWRLKSEGGGPSSYVSAFDDPRILINLSVWESIESLRDYAYRQQDHAEVFRDRRRWFRKPDGPTVAMWWSAAGTLPTIDDAKSRLALIARIGPSPEAFGFKSIFPPPSPTAELSRVREPSESIG